MCSTPILGIDTIRYIITLVKLKKLMNKLNLKYERKISKSMMDMFKKEVLKTTNTYIKDFELQVIKISDAKSIIGYMLVKKNIASDDYVVNIKKKKSDYREVVFAGLYQPTKNTNNKHLQASYDVISRFVDKCFNPVIDISIDGLSSIDINKKHLDNVMSDYITSKAHTKKYYTSWYINTILSPNNPSFLFKRLNIYDKCVKNGKYINWKRFEPTIGLKKKLTIAKIDEILPSILLCANNYFDCKRYDYTQLEVQQQLLKLKE